jgi:hypothetical protein
MSWVEDRFARTMLVLLPAMIVIAGCGVSLLPHQLIVQAVSLLTSWLYLSILIGIAVGHCALGESDHQ